MASLAGFKKVVVSGAAGFVGSNLVRRLLENGLEVHILVKPQSDLWRLDDLTPYLHQHHTDLSKQSSLKQLMEKIVPDGIFHLAASLCTDDWESGDDLIENNFKATVNLMNAALDLKYKFFVNTGSFVEYKLKKGAVRESDPCEPQEIYGITKLAGTLYGQAMARIHKKPIITFRLFTPYGPYIQKGRLIYEIANRALANQDIELTKPTVARDFIFIDDIVDLYLEGASRAQTNGGEVFNLGSGSKFSIEQVADQVLALTNSHSKIVWNSFPTASYDSPDWQADMEKTFASFEWRPRHSFPAGLKKTIEWLNLNKKRYK